MPIDSYIIHNFRPACKKTFAQEAIVRLMASRAARVRKARRVKEKSTKTDYYTMFYRDLQRFCRIAEENVFDPFNEKVWDQQAGTVVSLCISPIDDGGEPHISP